MGSVRNAAKNASAMDRDVRRWDMPVRYRTAPATTDGLPTTDYRLRTSDYRLSVFGDIIRPTPTMPIAPGTRLGVYDVTAQIGEGGMGQVFLATDTKLKRQVAVKILPPSVAGDPDRLARFQR